MKKKLRTWCREEQGRVRGMTGSTPVAYNVDLIIYLLHRVGRHEASLGWTPDRVSSDAIAHSCCIGHEECKFPIWPMQWLVRVQGATADL